jgi:hypothetical protein
VKITIESTDTLTLLEGRRVRLWEGVTEAGAKVWVFVALISVDADEDTAELDAELIEMFRTEAARFIPFEEIHRHARD